MKHSAALYLGFGLALAPATALAQSAPVTMEQSAAAYQAGDLVRARAILLELVQSGDALAEFRLGQMLATGAGGSQDVPQAMALLQSAFEKGRPEAGRLLATLSFDDAQTRDDYTRVYLALSKLGPDLGADGHLLMGRIYLDGLAGDRSDVAAHAHFSAAAGENDPVAITALAGLYEVGRGVPKDVNLALDLLQRAENLGHDPASLKLARVLSDETAPYYDSERVIETYRRLADDGSIVAQRELGLFYGRDPDNGDRMAQAFEWLNKAASNGDVQSDYNLGMAYLRGVGTNIDEETALGHFLSAGEAGHRQAQLTLASMYQAGRGTEKNINEAIRWFLPAANAGDAGATRRLGEIAVTAANDGTEIDFEEAAFYVRALFNSGYLPALDWLAEEASAGNKDALLQLADIKISSAESEEETTEGLRMLGDAANSGSAAAQGQLAERLSTGDGMAQNYVEAYRWANIASSAGSEDATKLRDTIIKLMTPEQIAEGQRLTRQYLLGQEGQTQ